MGCRLVGVGVRRRGFLFVCVFFGWRDSCVFRVTFSGF